MDRKADKEPDGHPSADLTDRHPGDARLRAHGFRIVSRPRAGVPLWERGGEVFTERDAHMVVADCIRSAAEAAKRGKRK